MKIFDWEEFGKGGVAVHCDTEEKAIDFIRKYTNNIDKNDDGWTRYDNCKENICYSYYRGRAWGSLNYYINNNHKIIKWEIDEEMNKEITKSDLKSGMVFECKNGNRYLVINNEAIGKTGWLDLYDYDNNLYRVDITCDEELRDGYNIFKVFGVQKGWKCELNHLGEAENLLWERKEQKEMSIGEIQQELGYKIKIVNK